MFTSQSNITFKNIMVQHTTLANASYMAEFNYNLYLNLLNKNNLEEAFNKAKNNNSVSRYQFCCCYHEHKDNCLIKKYLFNELFRQVDENNEDNKQMKLDLIKNIPHIYHLRYKCICQSKMQNNIKYKENFCYHDISSCENRKYILFSNDKVSRICCCQKNTNHNIDGIFQIYKSEEGKNIIFEKYKIDEYNNSIILDINNVPDFGKMQFIVGFNSIFINIFDFILARKNNILNFYGNQYDSCEIDKIISILIEFIKERKSYFNFDWKKLNLYSKYNLKQNKNDTINKSEDKNNINLLQSFMLKFTNNFILKE